jgi:excisionase family DNA binding protein
MPHEDIRRDWITVREAAALLNLNDKTVERRCRRGLFLAERAGRDWLLHKPSLPCVASKRRPTG